MGASVSVSPMASTLRSRAISTSTDQAQTYKRPHLLVRSEAYIERRKLQHQQYQALPSLYIMRDNMQRAELFCSHMKQLKILLTHAGTRTALSLEFIDRNFFVPYENECPFEVVASGTMRMHSLENIHAGSCVYADVRQEKRKIVLSLFKIQIRQARIFLQVLGTLSGTGFLSGVTFL